jgi:hypothetical protein
MAKQEAKSLINFPGGLTVAFRWFPYRFGMKHVAIGVRTERRKCHCIENHLNME